MEQKKTNREILLAALTGNTSDPEVRKILMRYIECWAYPEVHADLLEEAMCRNIPVEDVDEEVCAACKMKWLDREAEA